MSFGNHAEMGSQSASKVRPAATVAGNSPTTRSKKATRLDMSTSHRFHSDYALAAVIPSYRGDKSAGNARPLNGRSQISMNETGKHGTFGNTPLHGSLGR